RPTITDWLVINDGAHHSAPPEPKFPHRVSPPLHFAAENVLGVRPPKFVNMGETVRHDATMHYSSILPDVIRLADEASEKVLHIYESDFKVRYKEDNSPITAADEAAHEIIYKGLRNISRDIPILSEEG